jgi:hypothetical protein
MLLKKKSLGEYKWHPAAGTQAPARGKSKAVKARASMACDCICIAKDEGRGRALQCDARWRSRANGQSALRERYPAPSSLAPDWIG